MHACLKGGLISQSKKRIIHNWPDLAYEGEYLVTKFDESSNFHLMLLNLGQVFYSH